jgi:DNA-binding transcriptional ArsR family regulator
MELIWEWGTAYDFFMSLEILHAPTKYGLRGAWAAGMRARLPADARDLLEQTSSLVKMPLHWVHALPDPKDGAAVLWALEQTPPGDRLAALALHLKEPSEATEILQDVAQRGAWNEADREALQAAYSCEEGSPPLKVLTNTLEWWSRSEEFGERYLEALEAYQDVFFGEEEKRIRPALQAALARAQELAGRLALPDLLEELSQGVRYAELPEVAEVVLAPSYWITPLIMYGPVGPERLIWLFGARPADASLVPGDPVPDALLRAVKALSDPTRLRILRYLGEESLTPAELARRLRLRAPTVTHHLKTLRLAGLVQLTLDKEKGSGHYAARSEAVAATFASLQGFLAEAEPED